MNERREERLIATDAVSAEERQGLHPDSEPGRSRETAQDVSQPEHLVATDSRADAETAGAGQREQAGLSTADLAAAGERPVGERGSGRQSVAGEEGALAYRAAGTGGQAAESAPLFAAGEAEDFRSRWSEIQIGFVDEPRRSVEEADHLVAEVIKRLAQVFADERSRLEQQWSRGDDVSTEDLRVTLQCYRSFFDRLLSVSV